MSDTSEEVLRGIENDPEGFMIVGPQKGQVLSALIQKYEPKSVLEVGTNLGYSSILMAMYMSEDGKITTLELQQKNADRALKHIKKAGFEDKIQVIIGDAKETIPNLKGPFDFLFIDAAKKQYFNYLKVAEGKLSPGAVVIADNVGLFAEDMADYLQYVRKNFKSETIEVGQDALEVSIT